MVLARGHGHPAPSCLAEAAVRHFLPPDMIANAVDERIAWYWEKLEHMQSCDRSGWGAGPVFVNLFGQAVYGAAAKFLEENRDGLVDAAGETPKNEAAE